MVIAVALVLVVQMAVHQVINVVAVGHRLVAAAGAVAMVSAVASACVAAGALVRIAFGHGNDVLVHVVAVGVVQVAVVQVIRMALVANGLVAAAGAVPVVVVGVLITAHAYSL